VSLASHLETGQQAEELALKLLEGRGLELLARNYRCAQGELDLVMQQDQQLVIVEVRYRRDARHGSAADTVGAGKQHKLVLAAQHYLSRHPELRRKPLRFDVVAVSDGSPAPAVEWIQDAFQA
jgi:putative endonuclease